ncbi:MAG: phosphonopyruvate decarboxylase [Syntrophobacteraceae bacterium]|jgi:phosphonopyruvate decarboxylase
MIDPVEFIASLEKLDIRFVTGVPDSLLKNACASIMSCFPPNRHIIATNEGSAVGLAIGHYLATGRPALVYMQNAGLGNVVNPVTSLADPQVYAIPMVFMIGWRGEILADGNQLHDEPQHVKQGQITLQQLEILGIPYRIVDSNTTTIEPVLSEVIGLAMSRSGPAALIVRKQTFAPFKLPQSDHEQSQMSREAAIAAVAAAVPDNVPIVSTTGMASRELFEIRKAAGSGHHRDFLTVGGMGHAGQIAAGIALAGQDRQVVCLDGDGAVLMHMGGLAVSADCSNLLHIVINNGCYDSVGGQPTKGAFLDFTRIATACGYRRVSRAMTTDEITMNVQAMLGSGVSSFLEIKCRPGVRADLGRPDRTPLQNKLDLMRFLQGGL